MLVKIIKYMLLLIIVILSITIYINYECIVTPEKPEFMCHKGKLIRSMELNNIYLQVKDTKCEVFEDLIIVDKKVIK